MHGYPSLALGYLVDCLYNLNISKERNNAMKKETTIYGYDAIYRFFATHTNLSNNGHNNEYRFGNILFILNKQDIHIRIYDGSASAILSNCIASLLLEYDDFAIQYGDMGEDILILSRNDDKVSSELFMSIKGILA